MSPKGSRSTESMAQEQAWLGLPMQTVVCTVVSAT